MDRRFFLAGSAALVFGSGSQAATLDRSLRPVARGGNPGADQVDLVETLVSQANLRGSVSCAVARIEDGQILEQHKGREALPPASVAKAVTALYALEALGAEYRFETRIEATGGIENGIVKGDLILRGGGDPTLNTDDLARLAQSLRALGIREVRGAFRVDDTLLPFEASIDPEQPDHLGYSPSVSGIALNFNRVHFQWKRSTQGYAVTMDARTEKYRPDVEMAQMTLSQRAAPVYTYADRNGRDTWSVARGALGQEGSRWLPVRKPGAYAADVFRTMARANGVVLPKAKLARSPNNGQTIAVHRSAPLDRILRDMLKFSTNLTAEMVGMMATYERGEKVNSLKQSATAMSRWAEQRYGVSGIALVDHSGLGDASRMTAEALVAALVQVRKTGVLRPMLKPFPLRDSNGHTVKNHPIKVDAKTGTLHFVSGLGGFMTAADGTELAFAILTADVAHRKTLTRAQKERPDGARGWNRRSKKLQQALIERWGAIYRS